MIGQTLHYPRELERHERFRDVLTALEKNRAFRIEPDTFAVPLISLTVELKKALLSARRSGRLLRGFENAREQLDNERRGLRKQHAEKNTRVSRLLFITSDGSDTFHRNIAALAARHVGRLLCCCLDCTGPELGTFLFGHDSRAKCLLVTHKDAVTGILLSLAGDK